MEWVGWDPGPDVDKDIKKQPTRSLQNCPAIAEYGSSALERESHKIHYYWGKGRDLALQTAPTVRAVWVGVAPMLLSLVVCFRRLQTQLSTCQELISTLEPGPR